MAGTLPGQVLQLKLENGASVSDWLGTAMTAARVAAKHIEDVRENVVSNTEMALSQAEAQLQQAMDEVVAVHEFLARREAELRRMFEAETAATQQLVADMERDGLL